MTINNFNDLLSQARSQAEPQRLLFVFVKAEAPEQASASEQSAFAAGQGGYLTPALCVDKLPAELSSFAELAAQSQATGIAWDLVFIAAMSGRAGFAPNSDEAEQALKLMVDAVKGGRISNLLCCDKNGELVSFY